MSSMSSVAGLSKYIKTLPKSKTTTLIIIVISFFTGVLYFFIDPTLKMSILEKIIYGGSYGFGILGISAILSGWMNQAFISILHGINVKTKHSMFLSMLSMTFICIMIIIGSIISRIMGLNLFINTLLFGCILGFGFNTLVIWGTSKLGPAKSTIIGAIQPILLLAMYAIISFMSNTFLPNYEFIPLFLKVIIGCAIFTLAIYSFISIVESPMKKNLGIGVLDLLSYFLAHMNEGSNSLEGLFENMGEAIDTVVTFISFKGKKGIKALFISPSVHPGPLGDLGGSNMPTILANRFDHFTMVAHGPSTHDFNPVAIKEIDKIENAVRKGLEKVTYSSKGSKFIRYSEDKANLGVQFFNEGMVILSTLAPSGSDDIEFGIGLTMMTQSKSKCQVNDSIVVDCHNSFTPESGGVLPGNPEVFQIITAIEKIKCNREYYSVKVGCDYNEISELDKNEGVGESGIKTLIVEVDNQKTAYILYDANNMEIGFRKEIFEACRDLDIDEIEVMTTDTHSVNTISRGYNPIGIVERKKIIKYTRESIQNALNDLEEVEVGTGTEKIENLKTFGPNNSTELISTMSSIVAVSKIIAPVLFISALIIIFIWIFYLGL